MITNGQRQGETILDVVNGKPIGTLITQTGWEERTEQVHVMADKGWSFLLYDQRIKDFKKIHAY